MERSSRQRAGHGSRCGWFREMRVTLPKRTPWSSTPATDGRQPPYGLFSRIRPRAGRSPDQQFVQGGSCERSWWPARWAGGSSSGSGSHRFERAPGLASGDRRTGCRGRDGSGPMPVSGDKFRRVARGTGYRPVDGGGRSLVLHRPRGPSGSDVAPTGVMIPITGVHRNVSPLPSSSDDAGGWGISLSTNSPTRVRGPVTRVADVPGDYSESEGTECRSQPSKEAWEPT